MLPEQDLLDRIEKFLAATGMTSWSFGRNAVGDTNLVNDLKAGRELRRSTRDRIEAFMAETHRAVAEAVGADESDEPERQAGAA